jgi:hypothetical protein
LAFPIAFYFPLRGMAPRRWEVKHCALMFFGLKIVLKSALSIVAVQLHNGALSCAQVILIRKFEAIFSKNRWVRYNFRIKTRRLRDDTRKKGVTEWPYAGLAACRPFSRRYWQSG